MIVFARRWGCNERNNEHRWLWIPDQRSRCSLVRDDADGFNFQNSRGICVGILAARIASEFLAFVTLDNGGCRECRMHAAPAVSCARMCKEAHTSIQVQRRQSGIPCAMVLRLMPRSPRRRIRLATVAAGLIADRTRLGRFRHRQLGTSNGCRDHTVLPYATSVVRLARRSIAHELLRPAIPLARRRCRVHHIPSRVS